MDEIRRIFKGGITGDQPEASGKVSANVDIRRKDRRNTDIKIIIVSADDGKTLFKASYQTDKSEMAAYTVASQLIETYCETHDYIADISSTGAALPGIKSIQRGSRW